MLNRPTGKRLSFDLFILSLVSQHGVSEHRARRLYGAGNDPTSVAIGDLDGDGDADLAVANSFSDDVSVLLNSGDGTFAADVIYGVGLYPYSVAIGDLDGDDV